MTRNIPKTAFRETAVVSPMSSKTAMARMETAYRVPMAEAPVEDFPVAGLHMGVVRLADIPVVHLEVHQAGPILTIPTPTTPARMTAITTGAMMEIMTSPARMFRKLI